MAGPFSSSAHVYDVVYSHIDYPESGELVEEIIRRRNPGASSLLDVACGTGLHLSVWQNSFDRVAGVDLDERMLEVARGRLDGVPLHAGDFTSFDLGETFDAVTCMFSSIGYAHTEDLLDAAIARMASHLAPGGVLVVEPWLQPAMIQPPYVRGLTVEREDTVIMRSTRHIFDGDEPPPNETTMEFAYLVTTSEGSELLMETHVMGLFDSERYLAAAEKAGLDAEFDEQGTFLGRGLLIGVRR